jgi:hypothetical protein
MVNVVGGGPMTSLYYGNDTRELDRGIVKHLSYSLSYKVRVEAHWCVLEAVYAQERNYPFKFEMQWSVYVGVDL